MAVDENVESRGSQAVLSSQAQPCRFRQKLEIHNEVLRRIQASASLTQNKPSPLLSHRRNPRFIAASRRPQFKLSVNRVDLIGAREAHRS
ncbi:hypothetical protein FF1_047295 [Malus domestica]